MNKSKLEDLKIIIYIVVLALVALKGTSLYKNYLNNIVNILITVSILSLGIVSQVKILKQNEKKFKIIVPSSIILWSVLISLYLLMISIF